MDQIALEDPVVDVCISKEAYELLKINFDDFETEVRQVFANYGVRPTFVLYIDESDECDDALSLL